MYCNQYDWDNAEPYSLSREAEFYEREIDDLKGAMGECVVNILNQIYGVEPWNDEILEWELENLSGLCELNYDYRGKVLSIEPKKKQSEYGKMLFEAFSKIEGDRNGMVS